MEGEALLCALKYVRNFDTAKSQNPFAYITTIMTHAFIGYLNLMKRHSKIKQALFDSTMQELDESGYATSDYESREIYD
jgi:DNA-directed RNA polymerase specialized sigma24 family protein